VRTILLSPGVLSQLDDWGKANPKLLIKIIALITEISENPFSGTGKPEPLKLTLKGNGLGGLPKNIVWSMK
jgi:Txe/YoeB family toxin of Txe-Axe toxin-antitoxin module